MSEVLRNELTAAYQRLFDTGDGKAVLDDLRGKTTLSERCVTRGRPIPSDWLIYDQAQREFVLYILKQIARNLDQQPKDAISEGEDDA